MAKQFIDKPERKGVRKNKLKTTSGKLDKQGRVYENDLLNADLTSQQATRRILR